MTPEQIEEIKNALPNFTGTEQYHRFSILFPKHVLTDGAHYLADKCRAFWLMDIIASYHSKCMKDPMLQNIQFWTLKVNLKEKPLPLSVGAVLSSKELKKPKPMAVVTCERDTNDVAIRQEIPYTDFPLPEIKLYCQKGEDFYVIMLESEY